MSEDDIIQYIEEHFDEVYFVFQYMIKKFKKEMEQEKEKNKELEDKIKQISHIIDTKPYTAYTLYGDILYDDQAIRDIIEDTHEFKGEIF